MIAMGIKAIALAPIMMLLLRGRSPHFLNKHPVPQALRGLNILFGLSKAGGESTGGDFH